MARLFGTDGIRGVAGVDLTEELATGLGRAAVVVLGRHGDRQPSIVIGRDTRRSGGWLEHALVDGIRSAGGDAVVVGVEPTPAIAFLTVELEASAGVVISASHNPPGDNGIKFFDASGMKLPDELEDEIELALNERAQAASAGRSLRPTAGRERYLDHLIASAEGKLDGLRIVVDCANGAASGFAPEVLARLGAEVHAIHDAPDGDNINVGCGALHPEVVAAEVVRLGADAGVAHDGDADRAMFADADGNVVDGDQVLAACALHMDRAGRLDGHRVVTTVMANLGFHRAMRDAGIEVITTQVGDRYVLEEMLKTGAMLGGEQSGHVIFREHATTGDGLLTAVRFLSLVVAGRTSVAELAACMRRFPQVIVNVRVRDRSGLADADAVWTEVHRAEEAFAGAGRVLVRASGTEPLVRVMVEAEDGAAAEREAHAIAGAVVASLGAA
ncbi:MAG TPA: phosphoglucosamine mutase [Actinomycetota bacterium]|jgi:phosphoglucosamine mutase